MYGKAPGTWDINADVPVSVLCKFTIFMNKVQFTHVQSEQFTFIVHHLNFELVQSFATSLKLTMSSIQNSKHLFTNMFYFLPSGASQSCARMQISHVRQTEEKNG